VRLMLVADFMASLSKNPGEGSEVTSPFPLKAGSGVGGPNLNTWPDSRVCICAAPMTENTGWRMLEIPGECKGAYAKRRISAG